MSQLTAPWPSPNTTNRPACAPPRFLKLLKSGTDPARYGGSLYLAYGGDATLSQQRYEAAQADPKTAALQPWQRASTEFFWNRALAQPLLGEAPDSRRLLGCIRSQNQC